MCLVVTVEPAGSHTCWLARRKRERDRPELVGDDGAHHEHRLHVVAGEGAGRDPGLGGGGPEVLLGEDGEEREVGDL